MLARTALLLCILTIGGKTLAAQTTYKNLALTARATASESLDDMTPDKVIDGNPNTRWSSHAGHAEGVWFQLEWDKPITLAELMISQYDRYTYACDIQI